MGTLYIVATPIGNLEDMTFRALRILFDVDYIACEDTRRTSLLLSELQTRYVTMFRNIVTKKPVCVSYYDQTELTKTPEILELLRSGKSVALVSDAGTPLISDPGYILVREARKHGVPVVSIPGPSALLTALTSSGLPADKFLFLGYPPEKQSHRLKLFQDLLSIHRCIDSTYIFYCAPHKLAGTLEDMKQVFGDIDITVARELTKVHEEIWTGTLSEAQLHFSDPKGEFVIMFKIL